MQEVKHVRKSTQGDPIEIAGDRDAGEGVDRRRRAGGEVAVGEDLDARQGRYLGFRTKAPGRHAGEHRASRQRQDVGPAIGEGGAVCRGDGEIHPRAVSAPPKPAGARKNGNRDRTAGRVCRELIALSETAWSALNFLLPLIAIGFVVAVAKELIAVTKSVKKDLFRPWPTKN